MRMPTPERRFLIMTLVAAGLSLSGTVYADTIRISTVEAIWLGPSGELVRVDLAANPGAVLAGNQVVFGDGSLRAIVTFDAILAGRQSGNLRATFHWPDGWPLPFADLVQQANFQGADTIVFGLDFPLVYHPVPVTLTLSVPGPGGVIEGPSSFTFSVVQPVPEPTSLILVGLGLAGLAGRRVFKARDR